MKAYYVIGGVSPVEDIVSLLKENGVEFDEYEAKDGSWSVLTLYRIVDDFPHAKTWIDGVTKVLWDTLWKMVEGGHTVVGCVGEDGEEYFDDDGLDFSGWESEYGDEEEE